MQFNYKNIWVMSYPILISMLMQQLVGITDVIYLGRLSEVDLGASALGSTYFFTIFMVAFGFSIGSQIIMSRRNGEENFSKIGEVLYQGCTFLIFAAVAVILLSDWLTPILLGGIIENQEIYNATMKYINWRVWGLIAASLIIMARAFFVSITTTAVLTIVSLVMVLANVILNYILIFGKFGFPAMGIAGAAIASDLSEIIAVVAYVVYFLFKIDLKKYGLTKFVYKNFTLLKSILSVSVWTMLQNFVSISTWFLFFVAIEHLGERELAVANIVRSLASFPFVVLGAFGSAMSSITGNLIGQQLSGQVLPSCRKVIRLSSLVLLPLLLLMAIFAYPLLRTYTDNQALIGASIATYGVMLTSFLPFLPAWILFNAVSGSGNTRYAMWIEFVSMIAYVSFIVVVILYLRLPLPICWGADWVYNVMILLLSVRYMYSDRWKNTAV